MQIVSTGDTFLQMSTPVLWEKRKYFKISSAERFTHSAKR